MGVDSEHEIKMLFDGVVPENQEILNEYIAEFGACFLRCDDRPGFSIEAGPFGIVKFTQRTMHLMWMLGFAANQALNLWSATLARLRLRTGKLDAYTVSGIPGQAEGESKYRDLINSVYELSRVDDPALFLWPAAVPNPVNQKPSDPEGSVVFDLICMAGAYVFLHEVKHIMLRTDSNTPANAHEEEIECDSFAQSLMLDKLDDYARASGYSIDRLTTKRAFGIGIAFFFMLVITRKDGWSGTESHPSIARRIESMVDKLTINNDDVFWIYISSLFLAHLRYVGNTPALIQFKTLKDLAMALVSQIDKCAQDIR